MKNTLSKILIVIAVGLLFLVAYILLFKNVTGVGTEGLFQINGCYRNDELGLTYKVTSTTKGQTVALILVSDKYPSADGRKLKDIDHWSSNENIHKLYPVVCP